MCVLVYLINFFLIFGKKRSDILPHAQVNSNLPIKGEIHLTKDKWTKFDENLHVFFDLETNQIYAKLGANEIKDIQVLSSYEISKHITDNLIIIHSELTVLIYLYPNIEKDSLKNYIDSWIKDNLTSKNIFINLDEKMVLSPYDDSSVEYSDTTLNNLIEDTNVIGPFGCRSIKVSFLKWHEHNDNLKAAPCLNYENNEDHILLYIPLSTITYFSKNDNMIESLKSHRNSIIEDLYNSIENMIYHHDVENKWTIFTTFHFKPFKYHDVISLSFPLDVPGLSESKHLHDILKSTYSHILLNKNIDLYDPKNSIKSKTVESPKKNILTNVHNYVNSPEDSSVVTVHGTYDYYHYCMDQTMDNGWGCAYRSFQTICSWLIYQNFIYKDVPTHIEIQRALVDMGDKDKSFIGSKQWIGAIEISFCLDFMYNIQSKILNINSGSEMDSLSDILENHFKTFGSPVMVGGGVLAYTLLGIAIRYKNGIKEVLYLILDPHYRGEDKIDKVVSNGWCSWKKNTIWKKDAFYNLCLPIVTI